MASSEGRSTYAADEGRKSLNAKAIRYAMRDAMRDGGAEELIYYRAGAAIQAHGGFCKEHADVTYYYLMSHTTGVPIAYCSSKYDHAFVIIGDLRNEPNTDWVVADPWPVKPQACRWNDFFMKGEFKIEASNTTDGQNRSQYVARFTEVTSHKSIQYEGGKDLIESAQGKVWHGNIKTVGIGTAEDEDIEYYV